MRKWKVQEKQALAIINRSRAKLDDLVEVTDILEFIIEHYDFRTVNSQGKSDELSPTLTQVFVELWELREE